MKLIEFRCPECGETVVIACWDREDFVKLGLVKVWDQGRWPKHTMPKEKFLPKGKDRK